MVNKKAQVKRLLLDMLFYMAGSLLYALSVNCFSAPNNIAPGGITGLATVVNFLENRIPIGVTMLVMNTPLLLAAWWKLGRRFTLRTLIATVVSSVMIDLTVPFMPAFTGDKILTCIFGGLLSGAGLGLIFVRGATTGGTDVVARLIEQKYRGFSIGRLMLLVDAVIVAIAAVVYRDVESAMYAAVFIFVSMEVVDAIVYGRGGGKMVLIMSDHYEVIAEELMDKLERGVTYLRSAGGYTKKDRDVVMCAVSRSEVYYLRELVKKLDPEAFVIVASADEVRGLGFTPHDEE